MCRMVFNLREEAAREEILSKVPDGTLRWEVHQPSHVSTQEQDAYEVDSLSIYM